MPGIRRRTAKVAAALLLSFATALLVIACSGDDDDIGQPEVPGTAADRTASSPEPSGGDESTGSAAPSGNGSGSLTVDGQVFEFAVIFCGFTPEETRNENVPFSFRGAGENAEGRTFSVDASIVEVSVAGLPASESHSLSMWYDDAPLDIVYENGGAPLGQNPEFTIDDKEISYEGEFRQGDSSVGQGMLQATCP